MSDEANIVGKGREILLPPQGNPFDRNKDREPTAKAQAVPADEPRDLSPADLAARFARPEAAEAIGDEPMDLSPEDIAARFPSRHDDRNQIPGLADDEPVAPSPAPQPSLPAGAPPRRIAGKADEAMIEPTAPAVEPMATAEAVIDDTPITSTESPMPDFVADIPAAEPVAVQDDQPITSTEVPQPDVAAEAVATMPAVEPTTPPERMTMADTTSVSTDDLGASRGEAQPAPTSETVAPPTPTVGFKPLNPFAPSSVAAPASAPAPAGAQPPIEATISDLPSDTVADELADVQAVEAEQSMLQMLVTDDRVNQLWSRIDSAEKLTIANEDSQHTQRSRYLESLKAARNLLLGGRQNYEEAVRYVVEVEADLLQATRIRRWSYSYGGLILAYNLIWLGFIIWGFLAGRGITARFSTDGTILTPEFTQVIWATLLSGGLGGISKSLFSLATHIVKQDFERQHIMWYITSPLVGVVMGVFVVMALRIGVISLGGSVAGDSIFAFAILGWLAGFQQNVALRLVENTIKLFFSGGEAGKG